MDVDTFVDSCIDRYETLMDESFYSSKTTDDFLKSHTKFKAQVIFEFPQKWKDSNKSDPIPPNLESQLSQSIDAACKQLKKHFEKSKIRDQNQLSAISAHQDCVKFYKDEMDKYCTNHPNASPKELENQHKKINLHTLALAKSKGGTALTPQILAKLKQDIDKHRMFYFSRALMSLYSLTNPAIGIDLGTTMCCVMVFHKGKVEIIPNRAQGSKSTTPSYISYLEDGSKTFGWVAKESAYRYPETTIYDAKRMIGRNWSDQNLQNDRNHWPFEVIEEDGNPKIKTWERLRYPHEISAQLLAHFRVMAEKHLGLKPKPGTLMKAVITVPAYFTEPQRRATKEAATCAGLEVLNILSEPTAAAIAYTWERVDSTPRNVLIYDLGGGTFDVAIANVKSDKVDILGVDGDTHLGGQDFDQILMEHCIKVFKEKEGLDLFSARQSVTKTERDHSATALSRIKMQCEKAKENLSTSETATVDVIGVHGSTNLVIQVTRAKLNEILRPLIQKTIQIMDKALRDMATKGIKGKEDIQDVILVGGSSRMPLVMQLVSEYFDGKQLCQNINPDEAVAYGAAIQAAMLNKDSSAKKIVVQDVTPLTLGTDLIGDKFSKIIPRNSKIPCKFDHVYATVFDNQTAMRIDVFQGENEVASNNEWLGKFTLEGLPPRQARTEKARITMTLNEMGLLQVDAVSLTTGSSNGITIKSDKLGISAEKMSQISEELRSVGIY